MGSQKRKKQSKQSFTNTLLQTILRVRTEQNVSEKKTAELGKVSKIGPK